MLYSKEYRNAKETWDCYIMKMYEDRDGGDNLLIRYECGNSFAEWRLPDITCEKSFGFSEDDLFEMEDYLRNNEVIMWDMYREEVKTIA